MKNERVIVNKKSVKTTKKKAKEDALQEENNLVKFTIDNLQFNLTLGEVIISKFNEITPVFIEFSGHPFSNIDDSTKSETSKALQRNKEERERIRREELIKLQEEERNREQESMKDNERNKDQKRLREAEGKNLVKRMTEGLRKRETDRLKENERENELNAHKQQQKLRENNKLRENELIRSEERAEEENTLRHIRSAIENEGKRENLILLDESNRIKEKLLRDNQLNRESNNLKEQARELEREAFNNKEKINENRSLKEQHGNQEKESLKQDETKKIQEKLREENRTIEEEWLKDAEKHNEVSGLKDRFSKEDSKKVKDDHLKKEEENLRKKQGDDEEESFIQSQRKKEKDELVQDQLKIKEKTFKDDEKKIVDLKVNEEEQHNEEVRKREEMVFNMMKERREEEWERISRRKKEDDLFRNNNLLNQSERTSEDERINQYLRLKEREMYLNENLTISKKGVLDTNLKIDYDREKEERNKLQWEKLLENNRQIREVSNHVQVKLKEEGKLADENSQELREKEKVLNNNRNEKRRREIESSINQQKIIASDNLIHDQLHELLEIMNIYSKNIDIRNIVSIGKINEIEMLLIVNLEDGKLSLIEEENVSEDRKIREINRKDESNKLLEDLRRRELKQLLDEIDRNMEKFKEDEKKRAEQRIESEKRQHEIELYLKKEILHKNQVLYRENQENERSLFKEKQLNVCEDDRRHEQFRKVEEDNLEEERRREIERSKNRDREFEKFKEDELLRILERKRLEDKLKEREDRDNDDLRKEQERLIHEGRLKEEERTKDQERLDEEERIREEERNKENERIKEYYRMKEERLKDEKMVELLLDVDDEEYDDDFKQLLKSRRKRRKRNLKDPKYRPRIEGNELTKEKAEKLWSYMDTYFKRDNGTIEKEIIRKVELNLGRNRFKLTKGSVYYGTALTIKERLQEMWNDYQMLLETENPKMVNYISIEFMMGKLLKTNLNNLNIEQQYKTALQNLGYKLEDIYDLENDPGLGRNGLGKTSSCFLDSLTTLNIPSYGYGIRYDFGDFQQNIENNHQKELSQFWLLKGNPFEVPRHDIKYTVKFYGQMKLVLKDGKTTCVWENTQDVVAVAYDTIISGWDTYNVNTLRLWKSFPIEHYNFEKFHSQNYQESIIEKNATCHLTSIMYPSDETNSGKEFRLMQQFFLVSATIQDIVMRFCQTKLPWSEFPKKNAIHINDVHPALAIPEFLRILLDEYQMNFEEAIEIVNKSFSYTCHNILQSHMQQWYVDFFGKVLPRHLKLIYIINYYFLKSVRSEFPFDWDRHWEMSCIEESRPKQIKLHNLAFVTVHTVNGVSKTHTRFLQEKFDYLYDQFPGRIINITSGVNIRRWIHLAFPELSSLLTNYSGNTEWLDNLSLIENIKELPNEDSKSNVLIDLRKAKTTAKARLAQWVKNNLNIEIPINFMFDIQIKNIHENTRQLMNIFYCIDRYLSLKSMTVTTRNDAVKRATFFCGKADQTDNFSKNILQFINQISNLINSDPETNEYFKVVFIPDYKMSSAEIIIPASDLFQSISTPGTEDCSTNNIKAAMTGALLLASRDSSNFEIGQEIGKSNIFFFGNRFFESENVRNDNILSSVDKRYKFIIDSLLAEKFGNIEYIKEQIDALSHGDDFYQISHDYLDYKLTQERVDKTFKDNNSWQTKSLTSICSMYRFSSDSVIDHYSKKVWNVEPFEISEPSCNKESSLLNNRIFKPDNNTQSNWTRKSVSKQKSRQNKRKLESNVEKTTIKAENEVKTEQISSAQANVPIKDKNQVKLVERKIIMLPSKVESVEYLSVVSKEENDTSSLKNRRTNETIVSVKTESNKSENRNNDLRENVLNNTNEQKGKFSSTQNNNLADERSSQSQSQESTNTSNETNKTNEKSYNNKSGKTKAGPRTTQKHEPVQENMNVVTKNKELLSSDLKEVVLIESRAEKEPEMKKESVQITKEVDKVEVKVEKESEMKKENVPKIPSERNEKTVNNKGSNVKSILKNKKEQKISPPVNSQNESRDQIQETKSVQNVTQTNPVIVKQVDNSSNLQRETEKKVIVSLSQATNQNENTLLTSKKASTEIHFSKNAKPTKPVKNELKKEEKEMKSQIEETVPAVNLTEAEIKTKELNGSKTSQNDGIERLDDNPNRRRNDSNYSKKNYTQNEIKYTDEYQSRKSPQRKNKNKTGDLYESTSYSVIKPNMTGDNNVNNTTVLIENKGTSDNKLPLENKTNKTQETPTPYYDLSKNSPKKKKFNKKKKKKKNTDEGFIISSNNLNEDENIEDDTNSVQEGSVHLEQTDKHQIDQMIEKTDKEENDQGDDDKSIGKKKKNKKKKGKAQISLEENSEKNLVEENKNDEIDGKHNENTGNYQMIQKILNMKNSICIAVIPVIASIFLILYLSRYFEEN